MPYSVKAYRPATFKTIQQCQDIVADYMDQGFKLTVRGNGPEIWKRDGRGCVLTRKKTHQVPSLRRVLSDLADFGGECDGETSVAEVGPGGLEPYNYSNLMDQLASLSKSGKALHVALKGGDEMAVIGIFGGHDTGKANAKVAVAAGRMFKAVSIELLSVLDILQQLATDADDMVQEIDEMDPMPTELEEVMDTLSIMRDRLREIT